VTENEPETNVQVFWKIGHFGDVLRSQSLGLVLNNAQCKLAKSSHNMTTSHEFSDSAGLF